MNTVHHAFEFKRQYLNIYHHLLKCSSCQNFSFNSSSDLPYFILEYKTKTLKKCNLQSVNESLYIIASFIGIQSLFTNFRQFSDRSPQQAAPYWIEQASGGSQNCSCAPGRWCWDAHKENVVPTHANPIGLNTTKLVWMILKLLKWKFKTIFRSKTEFSWIYLNQVETRVV